MIHTIADVVLLALVISTPFVTAWGCIRAATHPPIDAPRGDGR